MYSYLVLSQAPEKATEDGLLEAWEIASLNLKADIAILSACDTARGRIGAGEGVVGLSWAFFVAGCPATVVSQWRVEAGSTTELMVEFHRNLRAGNLPSGARKSDALRRAALRLMHRSNYAHPFYWAAFVVIGDPF